MQLFVATLIRKLNIFQKATAQNEENRLQKKNPLWQFGQALQGVLRWLRDIDTITPKVALSARQYWLSESAHDSRPRTGIPVTVYCGPFQHHPRFTATLSNTQTHPHSYTHTHTVSQLQLSLTLVAVFMHEFWTKFSYLFRNILSFYTLNFRCKLLD